MIKKISSIVVLVAAVISCSACAFIDGTNTTDTADPYADVTVGEAFHEPPLTEQELAMDVPDFLTEEQQMLYRCARSVFVAFRGGYPFKLDDYPTDENPDNYTPMLGETVKIPNEWGIQYYYAATGRYKKWDDFVSMGTSIFTDEYFEELSAHFLNIDGNTYLPDVAMGGAFGYLPERCPDTFTLISKTDTEICFEVTAHFYDTNNPGESDEIVETKTYPITLVLTENGWRFSLFSMVGLR